MLDFNRKIAIFGCGGLSKDIFYCLKDIFQFNNISMDEKVVFVDKEVKNGDFFLNCPLRNQVDLDVNEYQVIIAIGNPIIRKKIVDDLPKFTYFPTIIHSTVLLNPKVLLGKGVVILPNSIVSCDVKVGDFSIIDRAVQIGHDCSLAEYVHLSPAAVLSGNVILKSLVQIGTNASLKQNIEIVEGTVIGMGAVVLKSIFDIGIYVGNPAKKIK